MKKILILKKHEDFNAYYIVFYDYLVKSDEEYEACSEEFLLDLFQAFYDYGPIMSSYLKRKETSFSGNANASKLIQGTNNIVFWDTYSENDITHTINFDDFLRLNDEFQDLWDNEAELIIFRREGQQVTIEGIWDKDNQAISE